MLEPEHIAASSAQARPFWWVEAWWSARDRVVAALTELIATVALLMALGFIYFILRLMILAGMPADGIAFLESVDFGAFKAVLLTFSIAFVLQAILSARNSLRTKS
jgi:hypothetical protein